MGDEKNETWPQLARELADLVTYVFNARNVKRNRIFASRVVPLMDQARASHQDFLTIIAGLRNICERRRRLESDRINNTDAQLKDLSDKLDGLSGIREGRRVERREIFEEAGWRGEALKKGDRIENIILTEEEAAAMNRFYSAIVRYYSTEQKRYGHEIHRLMNHAVAILHVREQSTKFEDIQQLLSKLEHVERDLEERWAPIARNYSQIKDRLSA